MLAAVPFYSWEVLEVEQWMLVGFAGEGEACEWVIARRRARLCTPFSASISLCIVIREG